MSRIVPYIAGGLTRVATTGPNGFALQNGTPTILSWTAPNDGALHDVLIMATEEITVALTGGIVAAGWNTTNYFTRVFDNTAVDVYPGPFNSLGRAPICFSVLPGGQALLFQYSAVTAGAATIYADMWAA